MRKDIGAAAANFNAGALYFTNRTDEFLVYVDR
jgi:hypothetical protein